MCLYLGNLSTRKWFALGFVLTDLSGSLFSNRDINNNVCSGPENIVYCRSNTGAMWCSVMRPDSKLIVVSVLAHLWIRAVIVAHANMNKLEESTEHNIVRLESTVSQQLTILYHNELHRVGTHSTPSTSENQMRCCYCQSIIIYITDTRAVTEGTDPVMFRLADLTSLYQQRLEKLGVDSPDINSTRLKEQLLSRYKLEAHQKGLDVLIAFKVTYG
ncbi:hypothetical protein GQR58_004758 [Nymphon striatum]|nr:hypothetical protein GQR58_004758 [Nymphon striatum]